MEEYVMLYPFLTDDSNWVLGYECGMMSEKMRNSDEFDEYVFHSKNADQLKVILDHYGYEYNITISDEDWSYLNAKPIDISKLNH